MHDVCLHERLDAERMARDTRFWTLYAESFPASERENPDDMLRCVARGPGMAFRTSINGKTVAMATAHVLKAPSAVFVVYMAVDPDLRGTGAGGALLEHIAREGERSVAGCLGLVWETERVEDAADRADRAARRARLRFFTGRGARILDGGYRQPALDGADPVPMHLLFRPFRPGESTSPDFAPALARALYFEKYQAVNGIDTGHLEDLLAGVEHPRAPWPER